MVMIIKAIRQLVGLFRLYFFLFREVIGCPYTNRYIVAFFNGFIVIVVSVIVKH
jgi:hypothetical protein